MRAVARAAIAAMAAMAAAMAAMAAAAAMAANKAKKAKADARAIFAVELAPAVHPRAELHQIVIAKNTASKQRHTAVAD